jgi:hypothetical protein
MNQEALQSGSPCQKVVKANLSRLDIPMQSLRREGKVNRSRIAIGLVLLERDSDVRHSWHVEDQTEQPAVYFSE